MTPSIYHTELSLSEHAAQPNDTLIVRRRAAALRAPLRFPQTIVPNGFPHSEHVSLYQAPFIMLFSIPDEDL